MGLNILNGLGIHSGNSQSVGNHLGLSIHRWRCVADAIGAVVVKSGAFDDRVNVVAVFQSVFQTFQHHHAHTAAADGSAGLVIEGAAVTVLGKNHAFLIIVTLFLRNGNGNATGQGHVAIVIQQILASQMNGHE